MLTLKLPTCTVDLAAAEVVRPSQVIPLTPKEAELLRYLADHAGSFCSRATLLDAVWGYRAGTRTHTLATNIYTLRQKIERDPSSPTVLVGRRGRGYCLVLPKPSPSPSDAPGGSYVPRPQLRQALERAWSGDTRRIALVGPAGVGKSRFVDEHRESWLARFSGGIEHLRTGDARTADEVRRLVTRAFAVSGGEAGEWPEDLGALLDERGPTLIIADDIDGLDDLAREALGAVADLGAWVVATTRVRPGTGWVLLDVEPFGAPDPDDPPERVFEHPAVALLLNRGRTLRPELSVESGHSSLLAHTIATTGGLPLAIEFLAAELRLCTIEQLADRARRRPQGMGGALRRSWDALSDEAREVFLACTPFAGPFGIDDVEAALGRAVTSALVELVDHSLLQRHEEGPHGWLMLLPPVRRFGQERWAEAGDRAEALQASQDAAWSRTTGEWAARRSHAEITARLDDLERARIRVATNGEATLAGELALAQVRLATRVLEPDRRLAIVAVETARALPSGPLAAELHASAAELFGRLHAYDDVEASLGRARERGASEARLRWATVRATIWRADPDELENELARLAEAPTSPRDALELGVLAGTLARRRHDRRAQLVRLEQVLDDTELPDEPSLVLQLRLLLGDATFAVTGSGQEALAHLEAALHASRALVGDTRRASIHHVRGIVYARLGLQDSALAEHRASAQIMRRRGQRARRVYYQVHEAIALVLFGRELGRASQLLEEAVRFFERGHGHPLDLQLARVGMAELAYEEERFDQAQSIAHDARSVIEAHGDSPMVADALLVEGSARVMTGEAEAGWALVDAAVERYRLSDILPAWLTAIASRARLAVRAGAQARADADRAALRELLERFPSVDIGPTLIVSR